MARAELWRWLDQEAAAQGFAFVRVGPARLPVAATQGLDQFLNDGFEGDMTWLRETAERRAQPQNMWPEARSAIVCAMNYGPDHNPMDNLAATSMGNISVYARGRDYHDVIKGKLKQLASRFVAKTGAAVKVFVDTAPLMEKPLAAVAGAGWQGKHTNLVSRTAGSWLFLGVILTDLDLAADPVFPPPETGDPETGDPETDRPETDTPGKDYCGSCRKCLDVCPTNAFPAPYRLDARRCISYLTIEHKGQIPREFRAAIGNRIFGCDDCLAVCPWNKYAAKANEAKLQAKAETVLPSLALLLGLDDDGFRKRFAGTPVRRAGHQRFLRNVLVAAGNSGDAALVPLIKVHLLAPNALVRGMAIWALGQLLDSEAFHDLEARHRPEESDASVLDEWARIGFGA